MKVEQVKIVPPEGKPTLLKVVVRCEGEVNRPGIYGTTSRSIFRQMNTLSVVHRKGVGVWLNNNAQPYGALRLLQVTPAIVNPKVGQHLSPTTLRCPMSLYEGPPKVSTRSLWKKCANAMWCSVKRAQTRPSF